jgi:murein DD-endopeptidase MepM/ murein hydrolase activator NlpD
LRAKPQRDAPTPPVRRSAAANRRVDPGKAERRRTPRSPEERRSRNRTVLLLLLLALVNGYVFVWRDGAGLSSLGALQAASVPGGHGPLPPYAEPPQRACGGDPVRVFETLEDLVRLETTLSAGYTLRLALLQLGVDGDEIDRVEADVRAHVDLGLLGGSGAPVRVAMDRLGGVQALEIELAEGHLLQACRSEDGFTVRNIQHPLRSDVEAIAIALGSDADLSRAVEQAGEKPELAHLLAESLAYDVDFAIDARPGDRIGALIEKRWLGRRFHRYGAVLGVRYVGAAGRVAYFRYKPEGGTAAYFDRDGTPMRRALRRSPVAYRRVDPEARGLLAPTIEVVEGRIGAVYRLPEGAPLVALADATVRSADRTLQQGLYVDLELADGTTLRYAHLSRLVGELATGTPVRQGQVIALAGHSGRTPSDRLRLEVWSDRDGATTTLDPLRLLGGETTPAPTVGSPIPAAQRDRFAKDVAPWARALRLGQ